MEHTTFAPPDIAINELNQQYFNGFSVSIGTGDVGIILMRNNKPFLLLQSSYTVAKTLAQALGTTISALEEFTGNDIMTTNFIEERLTKARDNNE